MGTSVTRREWDDIWWGEFLRLRRESPPSREVVLIHKEASQNVIKKYGERPDAGEVGPPWWTRIGAIAIGVPMDQVTKLWDFMNGKKTIVGAIITVVAYVVAGIPLAAALCTTTVCATTVAKVGGIGLTVVGVLHKAYKFLYREDHA